MTPAPLLVASDVDGTLIDDAEFVPAANLDAIRTLRLRGTEFVLATGRPPRWIAPVVEQLGFAPLAVCANGAVTVDSGTGEILDARLLDPETLHRIDAVLRRCLPGSGIAAERLGVDAADSEFVASPDYTHAWINPENVVIGHAEVLGAPAVKLLARMESMESSDMASAVAGELDGIADLTYSTRHGLLEFAAPGVTKASGLQILGERLGVDLRAGDGAAPTTVAFGDMPNDLEMLDWAQLGVAMGNAVDLVKEAADEVTLANNDAGLATVLQRWL